MAIRFNRAIGVKRLGKDLSPRLIKEVCTVSDEKEIQQIKKDNAEHKKQSIYIDLLREKIVKELENKFNLGEDMLNKKGCAVTKIYPWRKKYLFIHFDGLSLKGMSKVNDKLEYLCNGQILKGRLKGRKKDREEIKQMKKHYKKGVHRYLKQKTQR